jgi:hypothetical protein
MDMKTLLSSLGALFIGGTSVLLFVRGDGSPAVVMRAPVEAQPLAVRSATWIDESAKSAGARGPIHCRMVKAANRTNAALTCSDGIEATFYPTLRQAQDLVADAATVFPELTKIDEITVSGDGSWDKVEAR